MIANGNGAALADSNQMSLDEFDRSMRSAIAEIYGDYYASENNRYLPTPRGVSAMGSGADYHYRTERQYLNMLERARWIDRDNMVVGQGVTRLVANIVQDGFTLDVRTGDAGLDAELKERWDAWESEPDACDFEGEKSWHDFETLALRNTIVDGDIVILPLATGQLQAVEAHQLRTPYGGQRDRIVHGVELSKDRRRREAYHLTPEEINPQRAVSRQTKFRRYKTRDASGRRQVLHLYDPKRFSQTRGVTAFAPTVIPTVYHDDLQFAMLVKSKVASFYAILRERDPDFTQSSNRQGGARSTETQSDGSVRTFEQISPGATVRGDPGEKLQGFAPNIPNPEFFPHASLVLSFLAINMDLPLAVFLLDPSNTNFSGWRGAIDQARLRFRQRQKWLRRRLHGPVYTWKIRQWARRDAAIRSAEQRGVRIYRHVWNPPTWPYIEPLKDAAGDDLAVSRNLTSQRRRAAARGVTFEDLAEEIVEDRALLVVKAHARAQQLNQENEGLDVNWRELAYGHKSDGLQLKFSAGSLSDDDGPSGDKSDKDEQ